jgi:hypothetical protein
LADPANIPRSQDRRSIAYLIEKLAESNQSHIDLEHPDLGPQWKELLRKLKE